MVLLTVKEEKAAGIHKADSNWSGEFVVFCPRCKAFQSVWLNNNTLITTRKFYQINDSIYHDCGSNQACRLYRNS
jgi:hypothetical protein